MLYKISNNFVELLGKGKLYQILNSYFSTFGECRDGNPTYVLIATKDDDIESCFKYTKDKYKSAIFIHFSAALNIKGMTSVHPLYPIFEAKASQINKLKKSPWYIFSNNKKRILEIKQLLAAIGIKEDYIRVAKPEMQVPYHIAANICTVFPWLDLQATHLLLSKNDEMSADMLSCMKTLMNIYKTKKHQNKYMGPIKRADIITLTEHINFLTKQVVEPWVYHLYRDNSIILTKIIGHEYPQYAHTYGSVIRKLQPQSRPPRVTLDHLDEIRAFNNFSNMLKDSPIWDSTFFVNIALYPLVVSKSIEYSAEPISKNYFKFNDNNFSSSFTKEYAKQLLALQYLYYFCLHEEKSISSRLKKDLASFNDKYIFVTTDKNNKKEYFESANLFVDKYKEGLPTLNEEVIKILKTVWEDVSGLQIEAINLVTLTSQSEKINKEEIFEKGHGFFISGLCDIIIVTLLVQHKSKNYAYGVIMLGLKKGHTIFADLSEIEKEGMLFSLYSGFFTSGVKKKALGLVHKMVTDITSSIKTIQEELSTEGGTDNIFSQIDFFQNMLAQNFFTIEGNHDYSREDTEFLERFEKAKTEFVGCLPSYGSFWKELNSNSNDEKLFYFFKGLWGDKGKMGWYSICKTLELTLPQKCRIETSFENDNMSLRTFPPPATEGIFFLKALKQLGDSFSSPGRSCQLADIKCSIEINGLAEKLLCIIFNCNGRLEGYDWVFCESIHKEYGATSAMYDIKKYMNINRPLLNEEKDEKGIYIIDKDDKVKIIIREHIQ